MSPLTIGLTGGVASGKSLIGESFEALGVPVLDADRVAREVVMPGQTALAEIAARFGEEYLQADGSLDRRKLRARVFGDPEALRQLERITHPQIRARMQAWRDAQTAPYCILSVAILVESRAMQSLVDRILVVDAPVATQIERLMRRDGVDEALARQMIAAQLERERRLQAAHDTLVNDGSPEAARSAVECLHRRYLQLAEERRGTGSH
jgi:dephospho-CoA kinase